MKRKSFLQTSIASALSLTAFGSFAHRAQWAKNIISSKKVGKSISLDELQMEATIFTLPALTFATDALEPNIDKLTMEIHHDRHHKAYVDNLNKAIVGTKFENSTLAEMMKVGVKLPAAIRNNGGGHWNHSFFWESLSPTATTPGPATITAITDAFGSFDKFKEEFAKAATGRFGSGWAWLVANKGKVSIGSTPNQDNPLMKGADITGTPLLGLDVWEHAYYLKYQNKRADYIKAFWNVVDWKKVEARLGK
jgi:superoxide dismutase, Fe-Mn family